MNLSRRSFLTGLLATAAAAPVIARAAAALPEVAPIFSGDICVYNGVIIREVLTIDNLLRCKQALRGHGVPPTPDGYYVAYVSPRSQLAELARGGVKIPGVSVRVVGAA